MPGQLLPLRLLSSSSVSSPITMKLSKTVQSFHRPPSGGGGVSSVLNRVFPFKLRCRLGISTKLVLVQNYTAFGRGFSTGSFRAKTGSANAGRSFGLDNNMRESGQSKSLVEDEDELSDWISELKTDSFSVGLNSARQTDDDSYDDDDFRRDRGGRGGGVGTRGKCLSSRGGGRGGGRNDFSSSKRPRENGGRFGDDFDYGRRDRCSRGGPSVSVGSRGGGRNDFSNSRRSRDDSGSRFSDDFDDRRNKTSSNFSKTPRGGGGSTSSASRHFLSECDEDEKLSSRGRANGARGGAVSSSVSRGGRRSYGRGGNVQRERKQQSLLTSDDDEDGEMSSFSDLLSDEENSEEDGDVDDDLKGLGLAKEDNVQKPAPKTSTRQTGSYLSETRFDQCSVSPLTLKGIKDAGYERMTVVQEATLPVILKGKDVLAKAKTGTGKTVAFLLPAIEAIVKSPPIDRDQKRPPVFVLVICPTRELASQAAVEANTLLKYHPSFGVQVVIGGVRLASEQKRLQANPCQILVATPGRLADHIKNTAGFSTQLMGVKVLVLDEADRLLDMGFRKDIENIIAAIPKQRQTLLFSATVPQEVRQICQVALKRDHEYINTVEEGSEETHSQVTQMHLVAPLDEHFSLLYVLLKEHISDDVDYKVIVFCTTAMVTKLVASLLSELNLNVREIHSRKNQSYRKRVSDEFRKSKGLILVTSDVSARGVDYPDVTLVIQVGLPSDREQYIHRLGRTGRKGKEGQGILLLAPWEAFFLSKLKDLPITKASSVPGVNPDTKKKVERALSLVDMNCKESAYQAWLGFYNSNKTVGKNKCGLVKLANEFSRSMGLDNPPAIPELVLGKMGLYNVPGLRCKSPELPWFVI